MRFPNFIGGSFTAQSPIVDQERTVNFYVEIVEAKGASSPVALYPTPGVSLGSTAATAPGKAHFWDATTGREFAVIGNKLIEIDSAYVQTVRGTVATDANPATINSNGAGGGQLFITSGGNGYNYTLATNTLTQIAALNGKATMGDQLDGYFLVLDATTATVYFSNLNDGTTWDTGTDFFQRSSAGDPWVAMKVSNSLIYLLGSETGECWYNAGESPVPFVRHSAGVFQWGCAAPFSTEIAGGSLYWIGRTANGQGQVLAASGFRPEVVSNRALENILAGYGMNLSGGIGDTYSDAGHVFYIVTFPAAGATWCFDPSVPVPMAWHERGTWDVTSNVYSAWRPLYHAFAFGTHRMLDIGGGGVYTMSASYGSDVDSLAIRRLRRSPALMKENLRLFYPCFELGLEPGLGLQSGQGSDPQVMMRASNDGGKTWGAERQRSAGAAGRYGTRVRWERCGSARKRVFEVSFSDPIPWRLTDAWLPDFEQANAAAA